MNTKIESLEIKRTYQSNVNSLRLRVNSVTVVSSSAGVCTNSRLMHSYAVKFKHLFLG